MKRTLLILLLIIPVYANAKSSCEVVSSWAAMVMAYCPGTTEPQAIADFAQEVKATGKYGINGVVRVNIYSDRKRTPRNVKQLGRLVDLSDKDFDRLELAVAGWNKNTGFKEFHCRKKPGAALKNCTDLLKR